MSLDQVNNSSEFKASLKRRCTEILSFLLTCEEISVLRQAIRGVTSDITVKARRISRKKAQTMKVALALSTTSYTTPASISMASLPENFCLKFEPPFLSVYGDDNNQCFHYSSHRIKTFGQQKPIHSFVNNRNQFG
ncbi:hypothetical protein M9H77_24971 [Catharanthus roseus]|uniref:Uncharacterized protein n=1 Tax=Catharanthus roseus TaxID=4058 RepID=A0ACC0A846_CATRO|nr:hypothetical protein M9H77_24971 [Catharanthus roseus]